MLCSRGHATAEWAWRGTKPSESKPAAISPEEAPLSGKRPVASPGSPPRGTPWTRSRRSTLARAARWPRRQRGSPSKRIGTWTPALDSIRRTPFTLAGDARQAPAEGVGRVDQESLAPSRPARFHEANNAATSPTTVKETHPQACDPSVSCVGISSWRVAPAGRILCDSCGEYVPVRVQAARIWKETLEAGKQPSSMRKRVRSFL